MLGRTQMIRHWMAVHS